MSDTDDSLKVERKLEDRFAKLGRKGFREVPTAEALVIFPVPGDNRVLPARPAARGEAPQSDVHHYSRGHPISNAENDWDEAPQ